MIPTAGTTHDAVLENLGLLILPGTLRRFDISNFSPAVRTTNPRYQDFSLSQPWVMESWHHGRGALEWADPFSFYDSINIFTQVREQATLGPMQLLTTKAAAASINGAPQFFRLSTTAANLFCGTGGANRDIFAWNNGTGLWAAETAGLTTDPTDMTDFLGAIYVSQGEVNNLRKKSGGTWSGLAVHADLLISFGNAIMYRADNINEIYWTTDGTNWSGPVYVGDTNTQIRGLAIQDSKLYVGKDDGLYYLQDGRVYQLLDFSGARDTNNFVHMKVWQGSLYFPIQDGLYRLVGATFQAVGPDLGAAGAAELSTIHNRLDSSTFKSLAAGKTGRIVDLAPTENFLYAVIDGGTGGTSQVIAFNGQGWHQVAQGAASGTRILSCFFTGSLATSGQFLNPRLWYGYGVDAYNVILPFGTEDPFEYSLQTYAATGQLFSPWFDAGLANVFKEWGKVLIYSQGLTTTETLQVAYELDDIGAYQDLLDSTGASYAFTISPYQEIALPNNTTSKKIRLRFTFVRGATTTLTPKLKVALVSFVARPNAFYGWQVTARAGRNIENPYSEQLYERSPSEVVAYLERIRDSRQKVLWDDGMAEPAITNLVVNPSFRLSSGGLATNWNAVGAPTTAMSVPFKIHGLQSQSVLTNNNSTQGIETDTIATVVGQRYTASAFVYVSAGDVVTIEMREQGGGTVLASYRLDTLQTRFVRIECVGIATTTTTRLRVVRNSGDATVITTFYVCAAQLETTDEVRNSLYFEKASSYTDGDQAHCVWTGRPYASTSTRASPYRVFMTNIQRVETIRPNANEMKRGLRPETRVTFTLAEVS